MMYGYAPLARGYQGMRTLRYASRQPFPLNGISYNNRQAGGGKPIAATLITTNGINPTGSATDDWLVWAECNGAAGASSGCLSALANAGTVSRKYYNNTITKNGDSLAGWTWAEDPGFDLSGAGTVFNSSATDQESMLAKIIAGWYADGRTDGDFLGFMPNGQLILYRTGGGNGGMTDIHNYKAMFMAAGLKNGNVPISDVIANAALVPAMRAADTSTISDVIAQTNAPSYTDTVKKALFLDLINTYYDNAADTVDAYNPGQYAGMLFAGQGTLYAPMLVFSTGEYEIGSGPGKSMHVQEATFENAAPALYANLNHMFMSVVAVQLDGTGTSGVTTVTGYDSGSGSNKIHLAGWIDDNGTPGYTSDDRAFGARACGIAGKGSRAIDPWCFAAAGGNGAEAAAAAAGAVGAIMGAFSYMSTTQVFTLLALTADGPWLGTLGGAATTAEILKSYLSGKYVLPNEYQFRVDSGEDYLKVFAEVFGYGLINLERATKPGTKVYYYEGTKINSGSGNAYWRRASAPGIMARTAFSFGRAFGARAAGISVPVFDFLESPDGSLVMPRVFENDFALGGDARRGMYLGDALGEFKAAQPGRAAPAADGVSMSLSFSESNRPDYQYGGVDELSFGYSAGNYMARARFQRRFADAENVVLRADASNPVLALASNAVSSDAAASFGNWTFGARAFAGDIADDVLVETDPTLAAQGQPMRLGRASGAETSAAFAANGFSVGAAAGTMRESATVLGTFSDGMLGLGGGETMYLDASASYSPSNYMRFFARGTFARTAADPAAGVVRGMTAIESNAFSVGAEIGGLSLMASLPLAVARGRMQYATADYRVIETENGFALDAAPYTAELDMRPDAREARLSLAYRARLGEFTNGAVGFVYRLNPNHTDEFGNESLLMLKLSHKIGI
jgi:hypothetical protein